MKAIANLLTQSNFCTASREKIKEKVEEKKMQV